MFLSIQSYWTVQPFINERYQFCTVIVLFSCLRGLPLGHYLPKLQFFLVAFNVDLQALTPTAVTSARRRKLLGLALSIDWYSLPVRSSVMPLAAVWDSLISNWHCGHICTSLMTLQSIVVCPCLACKSSLDRSWRILQRFVVRWPFRSSLLCRYSRHSLLIFDLEWPQDWSVIYMTRLCECCLQLTDTGWAIRDISADTVCCAFFSFSTISLVSSGGGISTFRARVISFLTFPVAAH